MPESGVNEEESDATYWRDLYEVRTAKLSDVIRALMLAGLVVLWALRRIPSDGPLEMPPWVRIAGTLFILAIIFDVAHYALACAWMRNLAKREVAGEKDVDMADSRREWLQVVFWMKTVATGLGYAAVAVGLAILGVLCSRPRLTLLDDQNPLGAWC